MRVPDPIDLVGRALSRLQVRCIPTFGSRCSRRRVSSRWVASAVRC